MDEIEIQIHNNNLTRLEEGVFLPFLEYYEGHIDLKNSKNLTFMCRKFNILTHCEKINAYFDMIKDPFDCDSNLCHFAWLIRDNPQYFHQIKNGQCSNGKHFYELFHYEFRLYCPPVKLMLHFLIPSF